MDFDQKKSHRGTQFSLWLFVFRLLLGSEPINLWAVGQLPHGFLVKFHFFSFQLSIHKLTFASVSFNIVKCHL